MGHFAFLDKNNIVTEVITGKNEGEEGINWEEWYGNFRGQTCKQTSYNTHGGIHSFGGTPFRKNYAGIGYVYDENRDAFYAPQPFLSWILNEDSCTWEAPTPCPGNTKMYRWEENTKTWIDSA